MSGAAVIVARSLPSSWRLLEMFWSTQSAGTVTVRKLVSSMSWMPAASAVVAGPGAVDDGTAAVVAGVVGPAAVVDGAVAGPAVVAGAVDGGGGTLTVAGTEEAVGVVVTGLVEPGVVVPVCAGTGHVADGVTLNVLSTTSNASWSCGPVSWTMTRAVNEASPGLAAMRCHSAAPSPHCVHCAHVPVNTPSA